MRLDYLFYQCWEGDDTDNDNAAAATLQPKTIHVVTSGTDRNMKDIDLCSNDHLALCATFTFAVTLEYRTVSIERESKNRYPS